MRFVNRQSGVAAGTLAAFATFCVMGATSTEGAMLASDNASNAPYTDGWHYGDNGGTGFQPWAGGTLGASIGTTHNSATTAVPDGSPVASSGNGWNFNAPSGEGFLIKTTRDLTDNSGSGQGTLDIGQSISFDFDWGSGNNAQAGFQYLATDGTVRFAFRIQKDWSNERLFRQDAAGSTVIGPVSPEPSLPNRLGVHTVFTLTGPNTYTLDITVPLVGGTTYSASGTLAGTADAGISTVAIFKNGDMNGWGLANHNFVYNNLAVTPEPAAISLIGLAAVPLLSRGRRGVR